MFFQKVFLPLIYIVPLNYSKIFYIFLLTDFPVIDVTLHIFPRLFSVSSQTFTICYEVRSDSNAFKSS